MPTNDLDITELFRRWLEDYWRGVYYGDGRIAGTLDVKRAGLFPRRETAEDAKLLAVANAALRERKWTI